MSVAFCLNVLRTDKYMSSFLASKIILCLKNIENGLYIFCLPFAYNNLSKLHHTTENVGCILMNSKVCVDLGVIPRQPYDLGSRKLPVLRLPGSNMCKTGKAGRATGQWTECVLFETVSFDCIPIPTWP